MSECKILKNEEKDEIFMFWRLPCPTMMLPVITNWLFWYGSLLVYVGCPFSQMYERFLNYATTRWLSNTETLL